MGKGAALITVFALLQIIDLMPIALSIRGAIASAQALNLEIKLQEDVDGIFVYPPWQCDHQGTPGGVRNYELVGRFARQQRIRTNSFYAARTTGKQTAFHCDIPRRLETLYPNAVYMLSAKLFSSHSEKFRDSHDCTDRTGPPNTENYWVCVPGARK